MILRKVKLQPFAGIADSELTFNEGLTVVLGPNEAGKSTFYNAVQAALFTPAALTKAKLRKEMGPFIPLGGDTATVEMHLGHNSGDYVLTKSWGPKGAARLRLPDGAVLSEDHTIVERLSNVLPAPESACRSVLMTTQSALSATLETLKQNPETVRSLGDVLRAALQETDGISVEAFRERVEHEYQELFKRWDPQAVAPEQPNKRYKRDVGRILQAHYHKEDIAAQLRAAYAHEQEMDRLNQQIVELTERRDRGREFVESNRKAADDAAQRRRLEAEYDAIRQRIDAMKAANARWPVAESRLKELQTRVPELEARIGTLDKERQTAATQQKTGALRETFQKASAQRAKLQEQEKRLQAVKKMPSRKAQEIAAAKQELDRLEAVSAAGKLALQLRARRDIELEVQKDFDEQLPRTLGAGDTENFSAGARLRLIHAGWEITVSSGEQDVERLAGQIAEAREKLATMLREHDMASPEETTQAASVYEHRLREVSNQRTRLETILGGQNFEELQARIADIGPQIDTRPLAEVVQELTTARSGLESAHKERDSITSELRDLAAKYTDQDSLFMKVAEAVKQANELEKQLDALAPLPEGYDSSEAFLDRFRRAEQRLADLERQINELLVRRATLQGEAPEQTSEELVREQTEAREEFERALSHGKALARIRDMTTQLLQETDSATFAGLEQNLAAHVTAISGDRYHDVAMASSLPEGFVRPDGTTLPYHLLSAGTKDVLALALRLAMASYFLGDTDGFLMMDDPLVDMDPERRTRAAELIRNYARDKQVIVFTCHPSHAEALGDTIRL